MSKRKIKIQNAKAKKKSSKGNGSGIDPEQAPDENEEAKGAEAVDEKAAHAAAKYAEAAKAVEDTQPPPPPPTPEQQIADLTDRLQRMAAEFENYKKKNAREFDRGQKFGSVSILERLVPVLDSFDVALQNSDHAKGEAVFEGMRKIYSQMIDGLTAVGLEIIAPEVGVPLDPNVHEVLMVKETEDAKDNSVFAVFQRGYQYKGMLVRAAKVQVAKAPAPPKEEKESKGDLDDSQA